MYGEGGWGGMNEHESYVSDVCVVLACGWVYWNVGVPLGYRYMCSVMCYFCDSLCVGSNCLHVVGGVNIYCGVAAVRFCVWCKELLCGHAMRGYGWVWGAGVVWNVVWLMVYGLWFVGCAVWRVESDRSTVQIQYWRAVYSGSSGKVDILLCCVSTQKKCIP